MKDNTLFLPLHNTKAGVSPPSLHFAQAKKIAKVVPAFYKMVQANEEEEWFKMQVWMLQFFIVTHRDRGGIGTHYPGKWFVSVRVRTEERVQSSLNLSISKSYQQLVDKSKSFSTIHI
jgi:hypothetical protein